ncbi:MAG: bifunctional folylpolyglutamate synthase/dihydrofolate synthase [Chloroflexi bacterium]|nr:bifunctional folylpolyglutamate synthase/dihydrofolate synthase [Chloroflexota bacterium]
MIQSAAAPERTPTTTYQGAVERLLTLADFERKARAGEPPDFHLLRMETLLGLMGDPHLSIPTVHVAGTKGKGSTCAMVSSALVAHGFRTGLYTSPHLHTFRERIQVDCRPISEDAFACLIAHLWTHVDAVAGMGDRGTVTVFELLTAMAFDHFRREGCRVQVIEVGLGGRLDATNLVSPAVAVITPVGLDHVAVLGDTVPKIAAEKAGIIKPGVPVVVGRQSQDAMAVIAHRAGEVGSPIIDAMISTRLIGEPALAGERQRVTVASGLATYDIDLPLLGLHQVDNARTAIAALESLAASGLELRKEAVERGLSKTSWPARFQILSNAGPSVVVDGAHNADSADALRSTFEFRFPHRGRVILIYGGTRGHDATDTARRLAPLRPVVIATRTRHPKAVDPVELAVALRGLGLEVAAVSPTTQAAYGAARAIAEHDDVILATGSLFVAAEVIETIQGIEPELYPTLRGDMMPTITATGV